MKQVFLAALTVGLLGGLMSCGGGATRGVTGSLTSTTLPAVTVRGSKRQVLCGDVKVCCGGYDGTVTVAEVNASTCSFKIDLPLETFCYCAIFTGEDEDNNDCPDTYLASLGCSENGYGGAVPVFAAADDSTDQIDLGTSTVQGTSVVSENDWCASTDQDNDGTADSTDTDDDNDGTDDSSDFTNSIGCENADKFDSDGDNTPDIYEAIWGSALSALKVKGQTGSDIDEFFVDADDDNVPDFCDEDFECESETGDEDGDCIPDDFDWCADDADGDGVPYCVDCDDTTTASQVECYEADFCAIDGDQDGYGLCDDCDDYDPKSTYECFADAFCDADGDSDGIGFCLDCDDANAASTTECYSALGDFCDFDNDNDDIGICSDCDDFDATSTTECYTGTSACDLDEDSDGVGFCDDCDDLDSSVTTTINMGCTAAADACETDTCDNNFECQLFAEDNLNDEFETDNVQCNLTTNCCELK